MNQKDQTRKLPGFYIALCCCVIAIGAAGFIAQKMETKSTNAVTEVIEEADTSEAAPQETAEEISEVTPSENAVVIEVPQPTEMPEDFDNKETVGTIAENESVDYTFDNPDVMPAAAVAESNAQSPFVKPIEGAAVLEGYSGDSLKYNKIFGDWRAHTGVDLSADTGTEVHAASGGRVCSIKQGSMGNEIMIQHNNGYSTHYAQLGDIKCSEGDQVNEGDVIGVIGEAMGENTDAPHLHFEIRRDGKPLNPEDF